MSDTEKLDLILKRLEENNKLLNNILNLISKDTPGREFLLNLSADLLGDFISNLNRRQ